MNINNDGEQDLQIDLAETVSRKNSEEIGSSKVFIEINEASSRYILDYSLSDTTMELGGILLGNFIKKEAHYHICVEAALEALYTKAAKGSVTFTHKTWDHINKAREEQYPDYKIVGWFHTHPGFGIFLSDYDKFIHKNFFNLPWQVAYVIDPVAGQHGCFGWSNNSIEKLPFKALVAPYKEKELITPVEYKEKKASPFGKIAVASVFIVLLSANVLLFFSNSASNKDIEQMKIEILELEARSDSKQMEINQLTVINSELQAQRDVEDIENIFSVYIVEQGDTLWSISERLFGDGNLYTEIIKFNRIDDPDKIYQGDMLFLPLTLLRRQ